MKVSALIDLLKVMPQDSPVVIKGYEGGVDDVALVEEVSINLNVNNEWYYGPHEIDSQSSVPSNVDDKSVPAVYLTAALRHASRDWFNESG